MARVLLSGSAHTANAGWQGMQRVGGSLEALLRNGCDMAGEKLFSQRPERDQQRA